MGAEQISGLSSDQAAGMVAAMSEDPTHMLELESDSVAAMAATMDAADLGGLGSEILGTMVASMDSDQVQEMSPEHLGEALDTLGADYMGSGASGFDEIEVISFTIVQAGIEAPASLTEMMDSEGAANLFGSMFN
jgi:hypothetical protein